jgi:hypothetical protein
MAVSLLVEETEVSGVLVNLNNDVATLSWSKSFISFRSNISQAGDFDHYLKLHGFDLFEILKLRFFLFCGFFMSG